MCHVKHLWLLDERVLFESASDGDVSIIDQNNLNELQTLQLIIAAEAALNYHEYKQMPRLITELSRHKLAIIYRGNVVGFLTPYKEFIKTEYWRVGSTYLIKPARKKGITTRAINLLSNQGYKLKAWIDDRNTASQRAYLKAGFRKAEPEKWDGDSGHIYYNP